MLTADEFYSSLWLNSDVTFRSDTFLYKKLFNLMSYAKVIAVLLWHNVFFEKYIKIQVFNFSYQVEHIIYGNLEVFYFFEFFYHFILFFRWKN
jgi:hypothetical protein